MTPTLRPGASPKPSANCRGTLATSGDVSAFQDTLGTLEHAVLGLRNPALIALAESVRAVGPAVTVIDQRGPGDVTTRIASVPFGISDTEIESVPGKDRSVVP